MTEKTEKTMSDEAREFNPSAFAGLDKIVDVVNNIDQKDEGENEEEDESSLINENQEESNESEAENEEEQDDSLFDWAEDEEEEDESDDSEDQEESQDDWDEEQSDEEDESEEENESGSLNWDKVAEELGLEGSSKEDIIKALQDKDKPKTTNDTIERYEGFLKMTDRELISADMKASGMDEYDIEDSLDRMEDSGMLKHEALKIRKQLRGAIKNERVSTEKKAEEDSKAKTKAQAEAKKGLQDYLKSFKTYLGGKVTIEQRKDLYKYITSGDFNQEIYKTHADVAEAAFLWKNRKQIQKLLRSQGFEDGKANVLDNLTNRKGRSKGSYKAGSGFNASAFTAD